MTLHAGYSEPVDICVWCTLQTADVNSSKINLTQSVMPSLFQQCGARPRYFLACLSSLLPYFCEIYSTGLPKKVSYY